MSIWINVGIPYSVTCDHCGHELLVTQKNNDQLSKEDLCYIVKRVHLNDVLDGLFEYRSESNKQIDIDIDNNKECKKSRPKSWWKTLFG